MEARTTAGGDLEVLAPYSGVPATGAHQLNGVFSVVVDDAAKRHRKLPSLYVTNYQVFAHTDMVRLYSRLTRAVRARLMAPTVSTYVVHACRYGDVTGLYIRDFFNRAPFRRKLIRQGLEFSSDPYVTLQGWSLRCEDWGHLEPRFVLLGNDESDPENPIANSPAMVAFHIAGVRLGQISQSEFVTLRGALKGAVAIGDNDAAMAIDRIRALTS